MAEPTKQFLERNIEALEERQRLCGFGAHEADVYRLALEALARREQVCAWTCDNEEPGESWDTSCGQKFTFIEAGPKENGMAYCCYCGKKLSYFPVMSAETREKTWCKTWSDPIGGGAFHAGRIETQPSDAEQIAALTKAGWLQCIMCPDSWFSPDRNEHLPRCKAYAHLVASQQETT